MMLLLLPAAVRGQQPPQPDQTTQPKKEHHSIGIGIKAGYNFANITNASEINSSARAGYHFGIFLASDYKKVIGSHTELLYSRHGFNYKTDSANGGVNLDYIMLAQYMAINISKFFQLQFGGHTAYLLNAKSDSSKYNTGNASANQMLSYYNRFDAGFGGGAEVHPFAGIVIGARYSISLTNLYNQAFNNIVAGANPSITPNFKNNVVMLYAGYKF
jgi:hypothetical protein